MTKRVYRSVGSVRGRPPVKWWEDTVLEYVGERNERIGECKERV